ncbi:hypothetical protein VZT92_022856 [Zoarces viviparus]|uniref:ERBB receptor feedback inhibitor 1 n=1 Tax=Zoarces viviparus TaxID=48416 RepID=A0AAW1E926_ZOAVI
MSFSAELSVNQSPNVESRRRRFDLNDDTKVDEKFPSNLRRLKEENNIRTITGHPSKLYQQTRASQDAKSPQKHRFWSKAPVPVSQSDCVSKDYSRQSRDIDRETESPQSVDRFNRSRTCLLAPWAQEGSQPASVEYATSKTTLSKPDVISHKHQSDHTQNMSHKEVTFSDTLLNQTNLFAPSDHRGAPAKLPEYPPEEYCPFNTNCFGISSKGVFGRPSQPQHRVSQRPEETTTAASPPLRQPNYPPADKALIMEDPEDPYYVTMYYPGSVYVGEYSPNPCT